MKNFSSSAVRRIADNRVQEAIEQGKFENLPGAGKPIPDLDQPYDPMWWVKKKLAREHVRLTRVEAEAIQQITNPKR